MRHGLKHKRGRSYRYRGEIHNLSIARQGPNKWVHKALIKQVTDENDVDVADHIWVTFPFDLYTKYQRLDRIEFVASVILYNRRDGTSDYGLECDGNVSSAPDRKEKEPEREGLLNKNK